MLVGLPRCLAERSLQASQAEAAEERSAAEALRRDRHALEESVTEL